MKIRKSAKSNKIDKVITNTKNQSWNQSWNREKGVFNGNCCALANFLHTFRASNENALMEYYGCKTFNSTFKNDAARLWNLAPAVIKNSVSLYSAKSQIKKFASTLPL